MKFLTKDKISEMKTYKSERPHNNEPSPYTVDWTETLKRSIRERDHYQCQVCGKPQENRTLPIHHIDYNKKNCDPKNLITLCDGCHGKTNYRRKFWVEHLKL